MPPKALNGMAMSGAERARRFRARRRASDMGIPISAPPALNVDSVPCLRSGPTIDLAASAEVIASVIFDAVPAMKADAIVRALNQRLVHWRVGSCDLHLLPRTPGTIPTGG